MVVVVKSRSRAITSSRSGLSGTRLAELPVIGIPARGSARAAGRKVPGHWEGDLVIGKAGKTSMGTLAGRLSRYLVPVALPDGRDSAEPPRQLPTLQPGLPGSVLKRSHRPPVRSALTFGPERRLPGSRPFYCARNTIRAMSSAGVPDPNSHASRWILATIAPPLRPEQSLSRWRRPLSSSRRRSPERRSVTPSVTQSSTSPGERWQVSLRKVAPSITPSSGCAPAAICVPPLAHSRSGGGWPAHTMETAA
jgi:hypothetical protein